MIQNSKQQIKPFIYLFYPKYLNLVKISKYNNDFGTVKFLTIILIDLLHYFFIFYTGNNTKYTRSLYSQKFNMENHKKDLSQFSSKNNPHQIQIPTYPSLKNSVVTIYSNIKKSSSSRQQLGKFYPLQKNYFYKQSILLFYMLKFVIQNQNTNNKKAQIYCHAIKQILKQSLTQINNQNHRRPQIEKEIKSPSQYHQKQASIIKIENLCKNLEQKSCIQNVETYFNVNELKILLDTLVKKWTNAQTSTKELYKKLEQTFQQKIEFESVDSSLKIMPLIVNCSKINENYLHLKQNQLLYKKIVLKIGKQVVSQIIQTNQQKYVFFMVKTTQILNCTKIKNLFCNQDEQQLFESQQQNQSDKNSEIVKDQQFYRISSKISTSCRKNSFNSGQKQGSFDDQKEFLQRKYLFQSSNRGISENTIQCPISQVYTRSSSVEKANIFNKDLYTSIDLFMKVGSNRQQNSYKRKKSCQNPKFRQTIESHNQRSNFNRISSKIKINLFDEAKANIFSTNFKSYESCLPSNFPFLRINRIEEEHTSGKKTQQNAQNKIRIVRNFFKQNTLKQ